MGFYFLWNFVAVMTSNVLRRVFKKDGILVFLHVKIRGKLPKEFSND